MSEVAVNIPVREPFTVDNDMKAEWCINKIRKARANQSREKEELQRQMKFYQDQIALVDQQADDEVAFFENMLSPYLQNRIEAGFAKESKSKISYKLPSGELKLVHREPEYNRDEAQKAIQYCEKNGLESYVKVKKELAWNELKKQITVVGHAITLKETGEIIPGITVTEREDEFVVEVK